MQSTALVIDDDTNSGLKVVASCYSMGPSEKNTNGITLLFAHCIGAHKEQWEPTIRRMFDIQRDKDEKYQIREAWSFDWQNHGDAAVLNREALTARPNGVSVFEWAKAIATFARSSRMKGHCIVALGHSAGAGAMMLSTNEFRLNELPYEAIVLIEPAMVTKELFNAHLDDRMATMNFTVKLTSTRRDTWRSRNSAYEYFKNNYPWSGWDDRVVQLLVKHGLHGTPSSSTVTLKCDRMQEAVSYTDKEGHFEATSTMSRICHTLPVHLVWGDDDFKLIPEFIQESLSDASQGRAVASITKVEGAGHMIVQEQPDRLAQALCDIIDSQLSRTFGPSRSHL